MALSRPSLPFRKPRTPLGRAVLPIAAGLAFFALLFGVTWLFADRATENRRREVRSGDYTFRVGPVEDMAAIIERDGPILYPDLRDTAYDRTIVVDHTGDDPTRGWQVYYAYPADRGPECLVTHIKTSRDFVDCENRTLAVEALHRPIDARPVVENRTSLLIDLRAP
ncbi:MAG: hypothetical protein ACO3CG_00725 [Ilumatobacteraceae bacterium]